MSARALFGGPRPAFVGVVHLLATPGAPRFGGSLEALLARAAADARALVEGGVDALLVENFGDAPFFAESVPSETVAALALALYEVRGVAGELPVGVNVLRNDARAALGLCASSGAEFLRVNVHTGAMVTDQGLIQGRAAETLRERARLCPEASLWADVHVKHATQLSQRSLEESVEDLVLRALADGVIVSGTATGRPPDADTVRRARSAAGTVPIFVGSGLDETNARALLEHATGAIVGTALKLDGNVANRVDPQRVARLRRVLDGR